MLNLKQITNFTGLKTFNKHALVEYCQHELLDSIFKQKGSENFSFMGGTAIRVVYGGQKFSEDLDFDVKTITNFDELLTRVIRDMENKGFSIEFRLIHKDAYHCHIKFPYILHELGLSGHKEEKILIKVDASQVSDFVATDYLLNNYSIFRNINVTPPDIILSKKLLTIIQRKRSKGRDLYDVIWLWGMTEPNEDYLKKISGKSLQKMLENIMTYTSKMDLKVMQREVKLFLVNPNQVNHILLFPQFIKQKMENRA
ncbi:MAG: nucleotidyl transferase AbiEii/AbiGii toxin family protein [Candidatus Beckwithbacteria bacterium]